MKQRSKPETRTKFIPSTLAHRARLLRLIEAYYRFDQILFRRSTIEASLATLLADNSLGRAWLIRFAGCDAGYVIVTFGYDLEFGGRQATLTDLYIVEKYRRMGLGKSALGLVAITCRTMGITTLELQVERHNRAAQAFYRKLGFEEHDRIPMSKSLT